MVSRERAGKRYFGGGDVPALELGFPFLVLRLDVGTGAGHLVAVGLCVCVRVCVCVVYVV